MKKKDKIAHRVFLGLVLLGLFAVPVWTVLGPHSGISFWEQRGLAPIPDVYKRQGRGRSGCYRDSTRGSGGR